MIFAEQQQVAPASYLGSSSLGGSNDADVRHSVFACLTVLSDVKTYTHSLMKRLLSRNRTDVHENIIAAIIWLDESKAFVVLEQLNNPSSQVGSPLVELK